MKKLQCIIIEDEPLAQEILTNFIEAVSWLSLIDICDDGAKAHKAIREHKPELIFLDIHIPRYNGMDMYQALIHPPMVIFTTANPNYAVKGFDLDAVDYLLKPFSFQRFMFALDKVNHRLDNSRFYPKSSQKKLTIKSDKKWVRILLDDIQYIQAYGDYLKIVLASDTWVTKASLKSIIDKLPSEKFVRIHKSYVCRIGAMEYMEGNQIKIGSNKLPVGATYRDLLKKLWEAD